MLFSFLQVGLAMELKLWGPVEPPGTPVRFEKSIFGEIINQLQTLNVHAICGRTSTATTRQSEFKMVSPVIKIIC
jgi:hypothetical protein